jgi:hypothetical protein
VGKIIAHCEVYVERPNDVDLLIPAIELHRQRLGRVTPPNTPSA